MNTMEQNYQKYLTYIFAGLLAYSVFSHYNTGSDYTDTCSAIYTAAGDNPQRLAQILGNDLAKRCINRLSD
jgi:hypothetical protein